MIWHQSRLSKHVWSLRWMSAFGSSSTIAFRVKVSWIFMASDRSMKAYFEKTRALNLFVSPHKFSHRLGARIHWYSLGFAWFFFKSWRSTTDWPEQCHFLWNIVKLQFAQDRNWDELQPAYGIGWGFAAHLARFNCASLGFTGVTSKERWMNVSWHINAVNISEYDIRI